MENGVLGNGRYFVVYAVFIHSAVKRKTGK